MDNGGGEKLLSLRERLPTRVVATEDYRPNFKWLMIDAAYDQDTACIVMGLAGLPAASLDAMDVLQRVPDDCRVASIDDAQEVALRLLKS